MCSGQRKDTNQKIIERLKYADSTSQMHGWFYSFLTLKNFKYRKLQRKRRQTQFLYFLLCCLVCPNIFYFCPTVSCRSTIITLPSPGDNHSQEFAMHPSSLSKINTVSWVHNLISEAQSVSEAQIQNCIHWVTVFLSTFNLKLPDCSSKCLYQLTLPCLTESQSPHAHQL